MTALQQTMIEGLRAVFVRRTDALPVQREDGRVSWAYCPSERSVDALLESHVLGTETAANCWQGYWTTWHGKFRVGAYLMQPRGSLSHELVVDFDGEGHGRPNPTDHAIVACERACAFGLMPLLERSGSGTGWHLRILCEAPTEAKLLRALGCSLAGDPAIEVFPKQQVIDEDHPGSQVWLPYWGGAQPGGGLFYCWERMVPHVISPCHVYRHSPEELLDATTLLGQRTKPRRETSVSKGISVCHSLSDVELIRNQQRICSTGWLRAAVDRVANGSRRHDEAVRLAARLRDNRLSREDASRVMEHFQMAVTRTGNHPFDRTEASSILKHAYSRNPRRMEGHLVADIQRQLYPGGTR